MHFLELQFQLPENTEEYVKDLLIQALADIDFDTFEDTETGFSAFIHGDKYDSEALAVVVQEYSEYGFSYTSKQIPYENWNKEWESNFQPIVIDGKCLVRASFHEERPDLPMEIIINPKMAFGTGHHETTYLMGSYLLETDVKGKTVLDMGCGTAILAILAEKLGADSVLGIDNDAQAIINAQECLEVNQCSRTQVMVGDKESLAGIGPFSHIFANINRNILVQQMDAYAACCAPNGFLFLSGFYEDSDLQFLIKKAKEQGFQFIDFKSKKNWASAQFRKQN